MDETSFTQFFNGFAPRKGHDRAPSGGASRWMPYAARD